MDKKYIGGIVILLALIALALSFWFLQQGGLGQEEAMSTPEATGDTTPPVTIVFSPEDSSWHRTGFIATIMDSDIGAGLPLTAECQYIIQDLGGEKAVGGSRPCGEAQIFISVGEGKTCSSSFEAGSSLGACFLSTQAIDQAGNESPWKSAVFYVDTTPPSISTSSLQAVIQPAEEQTITAEVSDNGKIVRCDFFVDGAALDASTTLSPLPCKEGASCSVSLNYAFPSPGRHEGGFACADEAGNAGFGPTTSFRVFENEPPVIDSCRAFPTTGTIDTAFLFETVVSDPDGDELAVSWDFGDKSTSDALSSTHTYSVPGTYMPKVQAKDVSGLTASCETAWVVVE